MKRVMVAFTVLLMTGLIVSASGAFDITSSLAKLGMPAPGMSSPGQGTSATGMGSSGVPSSILSGSSAPSSSLGSFSTPSSDLQVTTSAPSAFSNWNLNNLKFFSPDNRASLQPVSSIPESDYAAILQLLSQLPPPEQAQQYYGGGIASSAPAPANNSSTDTFTSVSSEIPADQVIFIEVSKNTMLIDPTSQGIILPNVTMNYKFSDRDKKLLLRTKPGVDYNSSQLYFGTADSDDVNNRYVYDYGIGRAPGGGVQVLFAGADGRVRIKVNGVTKDLMPGEKYESITEEGGKRIVLDVTNWGLVPKANIQVSDTI